MFEFLFGDKGGSKRADWKRLLTRETLSDFLPVSSYNEEKKLYFLTDNTVGYLWEVQPVAYAGDTVHSAMSRLLNMDLPKTAIMQFILFADPYVGDYFDRSCSLKTRESRVVQDNLKASTRYWKEHQSGVHRMRGIPLRNFRFFVALKNQTPIDEDVVAGIKESLSKFGCVHVPVDGPNGYLSMMRRFYSNMKVRKNGTYDPGKPVRKQIISSEGSISFARKNVVEFGSSFGRCFTVKGFPKSLTAERVNKLFGGIMGVSDDSRQITSPFMFSLTVFFKDLKKQISGKAQITGAQKGGAKFSQDTERRTEEYQWAMDVIESGSKLLRFVPMMWIFAEDEEQVRESVTRAKAMWDDLGVAVQEESYLCQPLFLMAQPFGFVDQGNNLKFLDRDFIAPVDTLAAMVPIQADYRGCGKPALMLFGRKGQMVNLDLFDRGNNNQNFIVAAESGAGKSFLLNSLTNAYFAQNAKVRIIDIGYSYQKTCSLMGGRFLDVGEAGANLVINPFDFPAHDEEDRKIGIQTAADCLALMVSSASGANLSEEQLNLLKMATRFCVNDGDKHAGINEARRFLSTFPDCLPKENRKDLQFLEQEARALAFNLAPFCSEGDYGSFFNGKSTFDISQDEYVVLELERLRNYPQLFGVIVLQVMNAVTQDLYLGDRERPNFILFEEAAAFLKDNMAGSRAANFKSVIEAGYRRARKYAGSFGVVVQSIMDLQTFGDVGQVIFDNAATKFLLQGETYARATKEGVLDLSEFELDLLRSVTNNRPNYSEVMIMNGRGVGVGRLVVDPHTYYMNSSDPSDVANYNKLLKVGCTPADAINHMVNNTHMQLLAKRIEDLRELQVAAE